MNQESGAGLLFQPRLITIMKNQSISVLLVYLLFGIILLLCLYLLAGLGFRVEALVFEKY